MVRILSAIGILMFVSSGPAAVTAFRSQQARVALVELFTSEGCSSCPPADAWMMRLKESAGLWKEFVPVAFHVDYWDYIGWRDPWADRKFTERQREYSRVWRSDTIYTPGFVLNGHEWRDWRRHKSVPATRRKAGILAAQSEDGMTWKVRFEPAETVKGTLEVHAALLASGLSSDVKAGENRGRKLDHDFVALEVQSARLEEAGGGAYTGEISVAAPTKGSGKTLGLAVWVTQAGELEPLQATGGWLK